jgi:HD-like signal output (HDOD) protein
MGALSPQALIENSVQLFSLPDIYFQISEMINDPRFSSKDIGAVISKDPALSARLLKVVNSSVYGFRSKIDRISRAVTIVGIEDLKSLVVATSVINKFTDIPSELIDMTDYWLRSVRCGVIAKFLAKESSVLHQERLFLAGLLHDIGSLVFYHKLPKKSHHVLALADHNRSLVAELEQKVIGFTHADVGGLLIKSWGLPDSIYESIAHYLNPERAQAHKLDSYLVSLASELTDCYQQNLTIEGVVAGISDEAMSMMRLDVLKVNKAMESAEEEFLQVFDVMAPSKKFH